MFKIFNLESDRLLNKHWLQDHPGSVLIAETDEERLQIDVNPKALNVLIAIYSSCFVAVIILSLLIVFDRIPQQTSIVLQWLIVIWVLTIPLMFYVFKLWFMPWLQTKSNIEVRYYLYEDEVYQLMLVGANIQWKLYTTRITKNQLSTLQVSNHPKDQPQAECCLVIKQENGSQEILNGYGILGKEEIKRIYMILKGVSNKIIT